MYVTKLGILNLIKKWFIKLRKINYNIKTFTKKT